MRDTPVPGPVDPIHGARRPALERPADPYNYENWLSGAYADWPVCLGLRGWPRSFAELSEGEPQASRGLNSTLHADYESRR